MRIPLNAQVTTPKNAIFALLSATALSSPLQAPATAADECGAAAAAVVTCLAATDNPDSAVNA